ncbi:hypothetical protein EDD52_102377 [Primorskyibacter sedentarius]|uniref:Uncharacterized protein n=1 Tax=Primorskyibacter sedentarius TaxID=745311 RepID=A0A4R3JLU6_9RHOB|nr:hypothetical protein EDD52_102377 [Primorskyibacter sedentarius]
MTRSDWLRDARLPKVKLECQASKAEGHARKGEKHA